MEHPDGRDFPISSVGGCPWTPRRNSATTSCARPEAWSEGATSGCIVGRRGAPSATSAGRPFAATAGTPFYRLRTATDLVTLVLTLVCHGCPTQAIVAAFGLDERTVAAWLARGGTQAQRVHEHLVQPGQIDLGHVQADELWGKLVGRKVWMALALAVPARLWLGGAISAHRDLALITGLVQQVRACAVTTGILVCVDGLASYVTAFQQTFLERTQALGAGLWQLALPSGFRLGQLVKAHRRRRLIGLTRRAVVGTLQQIEARLLATKTGTQIHTAFVERLNSTFRCSSAQLARRSRSLADQEATLVMGMYLVGTVYNFCRVHASLRVEQPDGRCRWWERTPAMAAGLTDHVWSMAEVLWWRPPLPVR